MMRLFSLLLLVVQVSTSLLSAQSNQLQPFLGLSVRAKQDAFGYATGVEFRSRFARIHHWGLELQYSFTQSRGILPDSPSDRYILRDYRNPMPVPSGFIWTRESFPGIHLSSTPDKYFNFTVALKYGATVWKRGRNTFTLGTGLLGTFNDQMVLESFVRGDYKPTLPTGVIEDGYFPVFRYDTFLDVGILGQLEYQRQLNPRMGLAIRNQYQWFPTSTALLFSLTAGLTFSLDKT